MHVPVVNTKSISRSSRQRAGAVSFSRIPLRVWIVVSVLLSLLAQVAALKVGVNAFRSFRATGIVAFAAEKTVLIETPHSSIEEIGILDRWLFTAAASTTTSSADHMARVRDMTFQEYYQLLSHRRPSWCQGEYFADSHNALNDPVSVSQTAYGFPLRCCVRVASTSPSDPPSRWNQLRFDELSWLGERLGFQGVFLWPRLIANVLVLAIPIFALVRCIPIARGVVAWNRRRKGRCVACGYALAGLAKCPECGGVQTLR
jgi:hypothetical protein